jgi:hypothetical protein
MHSARQLSWLTKRIGKLLRQCGFSVNYAKFSAWISKKENNINLYSAGTFVKYKYGKIKTFDILHFLQQMILQYCIIPKTWNRISVRNPLLTCRVPVPVLLSKIMNKQQVWKHTYKN